MATNDFRVKNGLIANSASILSGSLTISGFQVATQSYVQNAAWSNSLASVTYATLAGNSYTTSQTNFSSATFGTSGSAGITASGQIYTGSSAPYSNSNINVVQSNAAAPAFSAKANSSPTSNVWEIQRSTGTPYVYVTSGLTFNAIQGTSLSNSTDGSRALTLSNPTATQYANLLLAVNGGFNRSGGIFTGGSDSLAITQTASIISITASAGSSASINTSLAHGFIPSQLIVITGVVPTTYNQVWVVQSVPTASMFTINNTTGSAWTSGGTLAAYPQMSVTQSASNQHGIVIRQTVNSTADLFRAENSTGTGLIRINSSGQLVSIAVIAAPGLNNTTSSSYGAFTLPTSGPKLTVASATTTGLIVQNLNTNPSADLQQWQNSSGSILSSINASGQFVGNHAQLMTPVTGSIDTIPRFFTQTQIAAPGNGNAIFSTFIADSTATISNMSFVTSNTPIGGSGSSQIVLYTWDGANNLFAVARTIAFQNSSLNVSATVFTFALDNTGGFPATYTVQQGLKYGVAFVQAGTFSTGPTVVGSPVSALLAGLPPIMANKQAYSLNPSIGSQVTLVSASGISPIYFRLS